MLLDVIDVGEELGDLKLQQRLEVSLAIPVLVDYIERVVDRNEIDGETVSKESAIGSVEVGDSRDEDSHFRLERGGEATERGCGIGVVGSVNNRLRG